MDLCFAQNPVEASLLAMTSDAETAHQLLQPRRLLLKV